MARRGFFAELQYQSRVAAREQERREREAARDHASMIRSRTGSKSRRSRAGPARKGYRR